MFGLFKRRSDQPSFRGGVWLRWANAFGRVQRRLADRLTKWTSRYSTRTLKVALIAICVLAGAVYLNIALNAFTGKIGGRQTIDNVSIPAHVIIRDSLPAASFLPKSQQQVSSIRRFNHYMDSLQSSPNGKLLYDSIMRARPGLHDSARMIESLIEGPE